MLVTELAQYILNFGKPQVQSRLAEIRSQDKQKTAKSQKLTKVGAFCSFLFSAFGTFRLFL